MKYATPDGMVYWVRTSDDFRVHINLMDEAGDTFQETLRAGKRVGDGGGLAEGIGKVANGKSVTILKETDGFIDYFNPAGEKIRIYKQPNKTIINSISEKLNSSNAGTRLEALVADFINKNTDATITDFGNKIKNASGGVIGDIDCATTNQLIEVKKSISSVKVDQFEKYVNVEEAKFFNVDNKTVILYVDEPIDLSNVNNVNKLNSIKEKGVIVVNGLEELKGVIQ